MTTETATLESLPRETSKPEWTQWWPLIAALVVLVIPTLIDLGRQTWSTEAGAHGPIVISTGLWLLFHDGMAMRNARKPSSWSLVAGGLLIGLAIYVFGRAYDFISIEAFGLYLTLMVIAYRLFGYAQLLSHAFPLLYLAFAIPPPGWLIDRITAPLQLFVSYAAAGMLKVLDYPIAREGVTIVVGSYQLLVEDACAGMNSLVGLIAISLFYIYLLHRASWRYALGLMFLIIPVAIAVNILRVTALILITYYFGNAAAQGFLHVTTGIVLFGLAILLIFGFDKFFRHFGLGGKPQPSQAAA